MIVDAVAARGVIQNKAVLFKKANDLSGFDGGDFRHHLLLYQLRILKTTGTNSRYCGNVESWSMSSICSRWGRTLMWESGSVSARTPDLVRREAFLRLLALVRCVCGGSRYSQRSRLWPSVELL